MKSIRSQFNNYFLLIAVSLLMIYPVFWWVGASLKSNEEMSSPSLFPMNPKWSNFTDGWNSISNYSFSQFYLNTFLLMAALIITSVISCSFVAFGFARMDFPLKKVWFSMLLMTMMLPAQVTLIPQYSMFYSFGWIDTYLPFIVPHALAGGIGGSFFVFLLIQFLRGIPKELDESAKVDGCSWLRMYWSIFLPLIKPALVTVIIYCFLWNWDDFFGHLLYINSVDKYTVSLALRMLIDSQSAVDWGQLLAMALLSICPAVVLFFMAQKHFVEGIATTGLKG
jgi:ABC-type glycerol-3-phosphate transport system permease component